MIRAALLIAMLAGPALGAGAAEPEAPQPAPLPHGAVPPPYPIVPPEQVNAFPPEILARMRAALVALEAREAEARNAQ